MSDIRKNMCLALTAAFMTTSISIPAQAWIFGGDRAARDTSTPACIQGLEEMREETSADLHIIRAEGGLKHPDQYYVLEIEKTLKDPDSRAYIPEYNIDSSVCRLTEDHALPRNAVRSFNELSYEYYHNGEDQPSFMAYPFQYDAPVPPDAFALNQDGPAHGEVQYMGADVSVERNAQNTLLIKVFQLGAR